jgi:hypothetical protein
MKQMKNLFGFIVSLMMATQVWSADFSVMNVEETHNATIPAKDFTSGTKSDSSYVLRALQQPTLANQDTIEITATLVNHPDFRSGAAIKFFPDFVIDVIDGVPYDFNPYDINMGDYEASLTIGLAADINVFSIIEGHYLDYNTMSNIPDTLWLGMGFYLISRVESVTISVDMFLTGDNEQYYFEDRLLDTVIPIENNHCEYTFTYEPQGNSIDYLLERFNIHKHRGVSTGIENPKNSDSNNGNAIFIDNGNLHVVQKDGADILEITVFSLDGRLLFSQKEINLPQWAKASKNFGNIFIVKVLTTKNIYTQKIINIKQ